ncbi:hypothetical protein sos41_27900 [Alphaproteobacteria bacterium SO-S41]|nr:hypothetical protein sos41_27900 [Alphaproteobacteria bacterium SO-S41]
MGTRLWAAACAALSLTGCMSGADYAGRVVEHNRAIADAADQILLLNVVRAQHGRPVVYSQFSGVSESFSNNLGLSVSAPFGADADSAYSADFSTGPSQDVTLATAPLDDVDYYQGVMRPVKIGLLRYYLDNGWPPDLLLALTVEKLTISEDFYARVVAESNALCAGVATGACGRINDPARLHNRPPTDRGRLVFSNDPRTPELFDPFHDLVLRLIVLGLTVDGSAKTVETRVPAGSEFYTDAEMLGKLMDMGATVKRQGGDYVISAPSWTPGFRLTHLGQTSVRVEGDMTAAAEVDMTASLRSPDSILFFIGAYVREGGADASVLVGRPGEEQFVQVFEVGSCSDAVVQVDFDGACYGIPRESAGITMRVVAFLHQVFGLNKRAVEPPSSGTVRVVN